MLTVNCLFICFVQLCFYFVLSTADAVYEEDVYLLILRAVTGTGNGEVYLC